MTPQAPAQNNFLSRATDLVNRGFSVIPIEPRGKRPSGPGATSRTRDLETVKVWAASWPDANAAVCADENITILESDDAARFRGVLAGLGVTLPETLTGGASENRPHWFYKRTAACGDVCLEVPGVFEFRNVNQYVVGPGSIHSSGAEYRFWKDVPMVALPGRGHRCLAPAGRGIQRGKRKANTSGQGLIRRSVMPTCAAWTPRTC